MKVCIFNSFPFHYEMFAYILDYFKERGLTIDVYTNTVNHHGWLDFYEKHYGVFVWFPISFFNPEAYDYVFILTDDDKAYKSEWNNKTKVIIIEHDGKRNNVGAYFTIQNRQFKLRNPPSDPNTCIMPVWNNSFYDKYNKLTVVSIGSSSDTLNLPALFSNFEEINFLLIDRRINSSVSKNITKYNKLDTSKLIEYSARAHYILFWPSSPEQLEHEHHSISGSFPLAFSVGTPLLLPERFIRSLGFNGIVGIPDSPIHLEKPSEELYNKVKVQRNAYLEKRNSLFNMILFGDTINFSRL